MIAFSSSIPALKNFTKPHVQKAKTQKFDTINSIIHNTSCAARPNRCISVYYYHYSQTDTHTHFCTMRVGDTHKIFIIIACRFQFSVGLASVWCCLYPSSHYIVLRLWRWLAGWLRINHFPFLLAVLCLLVPSLLQYLSTTTTTWCL